MCSSIFSESLVDSSVEGNHGFSRRGMKQVKRKMTRATHNFLNSLSFSFFFPLREPLPNLTGASCTEFVTRFPGMMTGKEERE